MSHWATDPDYGADEYSYMSFRVHDGGACINDSARYIIAEDTAKPQPGQPLRIDTSIFLLRSDDYYKNAFGGCLDDIRDTITPQSFEDEYGMLDMKVDAEMLQKTQQGIRGNHRED